MSSCMLETDVGADVRRPETNEILQYRPEVVVSTCLRRSGRGQPGGHV
jgi:hypothetical protein